MMIQRGESERLCALVGLAVGGQRIVRSCMIITLTKDSKKKGLVHGNASPLYGLSPRHLAVCTPRNVYYTASQIISADSETQHRGPGQRGADCV